MKLTDNGEKFPDWWKSDAIELPRHMYDIISELDKRNSARRDRNLRTLMLYGNYSLMSQDPSTYLRGNNPVMPEQRVKYNIISSMCDTVAAKISKMKPRVTFLTTKGDYATQVQAKKLTMYVDGAFYRNDIYNLHQAGFRDSTIFDIGIIKHFIDPKSLTLKSERCLPTEVYVDDSDAIYGQPRSLYQIKRVAKSTLQKMFPKKSALIKDSTAALSSNMSSKQPDVSDYVIVMEAWHLPTNPDAKDGRHIICTDKATLLDDEYNKDYFPFTFFYWSKPPIGMYGQSLAERLTGNQVEINKMLRMIQKAFHLGSAFKVFVEYGSKVVKEHLNNDIGSIIYYAGEKPTFMVPQTVHPEYFQHLDRLIKMSYEEAGVSQMGAASKVPAGIDGGSGRAIREYNNLETERFALISQAYEESFLHTARIYIDLSKDLKEMGGDFEVVAQSKQFMDTIKWSEIAVDENEYIMRMYPTNFLPNEPTGRIATIQELLQAGLIDPAYAKSLLDFPDIAEYDSIQDAGIEDIKDTAYQIISKGKYIGPEPFQDLEHGISYFQLIYLRSKKDQVPEDRLDLLRRWIASAKALQDQAKKATQPVPMAPGQPGQPAPGPAPQLTQGPNNPNPIAGMPLAGPQ